MTYIIGTYPLLTTTFVDREIHQMRARGVDVRVVSLRRPERMLSVAQRADMADVTYVLPVSPIRLVAAHLRFLITRPLTLLSTYVDITARPHDDIRSRLRTMLHVGEGVVVADLIRKSVSTHLHAHFVDRATTVAWVCSRLLGVPFSATAHANDIYVRPVLLADKLRAASFVATCTEYNADHLRSLLGDMAGRIVAVHHGLDLNGFAPPGDRPTVPATLLAVGQLREKKGLQHLIDAAAILVRRGRDLRVVIVGEGPLRATLEDRILHHGLGAVVTLVGAVPHDEVIRLMQGATLFVLPAVQAADGDRDGIPNVILEAMAMALPVVSTRHSGIPEAVVHEETGLLVEPGNVAELAEAVDRLLAGPDEAARMGRIGRERVHAKFDIERNVETLLELVRS